MAGTKGKKKQTRLAFAPIEADALGPIASPSSFTPSRLRYFNPLSKNVTIKGQLQLEDYTRDWRNAGKLRSDNPTLNGARHQQPSSSEANRESATKSNRFHSRLTSNTTKLDNDDSSLSDLDVIRPSKRRRIQTITLSDSDDQNSRPSLDNSTKGYSSNRAVKSESKMQPTPSRRSERLKAHFSPGSDGSPRSKSLKIDLSGLGESEESPSQELTSSPTTNRRRRGRPPTKPKAPSIVDDDTEDSDVVILSARRKKLKTDMAVPKTVRTTPTVTDDDGDSSDDDVVAFTPSRRNSRKSPRVSSTDDSDDDDNEDLPKTPRRLRSGQDVLDLEEDLQDLRDTDLRDKRTRGAVVNSARSARQKHLEMLKRRRAGEKVITDPAETADEEDYDYENDPHTNAVNAILDWVGTSTTRHNDDVDDDVDSVVGASPDLDTDDSSFVEQDGELGAPISIPFEFSRHRTKTIKECFRDVIEWMVHSKLNPAFPRNDDMYQFAFRKVDDELVGRVGSQLVSTVWSAEFRNALLARPYLDVTGCPLSGMQSCQACNRSKHPVSSDLKFSGKPYSEETLEPLDDSDSDSDSNEEDNDVISGHRKPDRDREGHVLPPEEQHFYLGKFCKSNAVLTHTLTHWRFHLYEWVVDYLNREEELLSSPQKSLDREKLSSKKRTKYANKVVDKMDENGEVQRLWRDFHQTMGSVRKMHEDTDEEAARF